jgi:hypothetical protein
MLAYDGRFFLLSHILSPTWDYVRMLAFFPGFTSLLLPFTFVHPEPEAR